MPSSVFIDGEAGTTGLQIRERLQRRGDLQLRSLPADQRKDPAARADALNSADVAILCLPDEAARAAVAMIQSDATVVIDASTAHRTSAGWIYGFPELARGQRDLIRSARRIANPGCYATGFIALVRPLVDAGILPSDSPLSVNAISGYTGGGKAMITEFEAEPTEQGQAPVYRIYATGLQHKHLPEMRAHAGLEHPPVFAPAVSRFPQGMIVEVPLQLWSMPGLPGLADLQRALEQAYAGERFIEVVSRDEAKTMGELDPRLCNHTNQMKLMVFGDDAGRQARLVAVLDNLGKGAAGAAVQNLNIALGLPEHQGLEG